MVGLVVVWFFCLICGFGCGLICEFRCGFDLCDFFFFHWVCLYWSRIGKVVEERNLGKKGKKI